MELGIIRFQWLNEGFLSFSNDIFDFWQGLLMSWVWFGGFGVVTELG